MRRILVTNDDGYRSDGIRALAQALGACGDVTIVAPVEEASAIGHALTLRHPLRLERIDDHTWAVDGTPTDCVNVAVAQVFGALPDLVVSGINTGWNLGDDVTYSGTVAGALEGALLGVPAIAVSLAGARDYVFDFGPSAQAAALLADLVLQHGLPDRTFLNVNVPKGRPRGFKRTVQGKRNHITKISERIDPRGKPYYWIEEGIDEWTTHDRSDYHAVKQGYVSVSLLHPDLTAHSVFDELEQFPLPDLGSGGSGEAGEAGGSGETSGSRESRGSG